MTHDQRIVAHIRSVLDKTVAGMSDRGLLQAYACWHVYGGQRWSTFYTYTHPAVRVMAYARVFDTN